jgi:putative transposase
MAELTLEQIMVGAQMVERGLQAGDLVRHEGPWKGMEDLDLATLSWVWRVNNKRLFGPIGHVPAVEW